jgi:3-oxoacyl-[acyl-carrier-protein] synthase I
MIQQQSVCVTAHGMVGAPAHDSVSACAAARAGMIRTRRFDYRVVGDDGDVEQIVAHAAYPLTNGFEGDARLTRLLQCALNDLWRRAAGPDVFSSATVGAYLAVPSDDRCHTGLPLVANTTTRTMRQKEAADHKWLGTSERIRGASILQKACFFNGRQVTPSNLEVVTNGHTAFSACCRHAIKDLEAKRVEMALVVGVDSLLDHDTLRWLEDTGRLKCSRTPTGLRPGEAGAAIVLETVEFAVARRAQPLALLLGIHSAIDPQSCLDGKQPIGHGISEMLSGLFTTVDSRRPSGTWFISDLNGETARSMDWGCALVRLAARNPAITVPAPFCSSVSFGDVGVATGAVATCIALGAFERRWAPAPVAAILSSSDDGERSGFLVCASGPNSHGRER